MVDELAPGVHERRHTFRVRHISIAGADHEIADGARIVAAERDGDAVGKLRRADAAKFGAAGVELCVGHAVAGAIERPERDLP